MVSIISLYYSGILASKPATSSIALGLMHTRHSPEFLCGDSSLYLKSTYCFRAHMHEIIKYFLLTEMLDCCPRIGMLASGEYGIAQLGTNRRDQKPPRRCEIWTLDNCANQKSISPLSFAVLTDDTAFHSSSTHIRVRVQLIGHARNNM